MSSRFARFSAAGVHLPLRFLSFSGPLRWQRMLAPTGFTGTTAALTKVTFLFQSVDCILPAKLGDVYGAHLMKLNFGLNRSFAFGSNISLAVAGFGGRVSVRDGRGGVTVSGAFPGGITAGLESGRAMFAADLAADRAVHYFRKNVWQRKSFRPKLNHFLASFREGLRLPWRSLPLLLLLTLLTWGVEVLRLYFACRALGCT